MGNGKLPKTGSAPSAPGWHHVSTLQKSLLHALNGCTLCPRQLENPMPRSSSSRPRPDLWGPLRAATASKGTGSTSSREKLAQKWQKVKGEGAFTGVPGIVTIHTGGEDSVWIKKAGKSRLRWQEVGPQGLALRVVLRVGTPQLLRPDNTRTSPTTCRMF